jgi:hypothetical protein
MKLYWFKGKPGESVYINPEAISSIHECDGVYTIYMIGGYNYYDVGVDAVRVLLDDFLFEGAR